MGDFKCDVKNTILNLFLLPKPEKNDRDFIFSD